jgi:hypothetical protein
MRRQCEGVCTDVSCGVYSSRRTCELLATTSCAVLQGVMLASLRVDLQLSDCSEQRGIYFVLQYHPCLHCTFAVVPLSMWMSNCESHVNTMGETCFALTTLRQNFTLKVHQIWLS